MSTPQVVTHHLQQVLGWSAAHVDLDRAVADVPPRQRGIRPAGLPRSIWELVEHVRIAQADILEYCRSADYTAPAWPDDYWPDGPAPPSEEAWRATLDAVRRDRRELARLIREVDPSEPIPHAGEPTHTYVRELLLVADHTAYHVGQIVLVRRLLGVWPDP